MKNKANIKEQAFNCPHCGVYTTQYWNSVHIKKSPNNALPYIPGFEEMSNIESDTKMDIYQKERAIDFVRMFLTGKPFIGLVSKVSSNTYPIYNINISKCYHCNQFTIWVNDKIVYPSYKVEIEPNIDLSERIKELFNEARDIVDGSPRGAAGLLRLCVQYLLKDLGQSGKNIDKDIAQLVKDGLDPLLVDALDVVRVMGNEAVHPGTIDLNDDREIAYRLFEIVNIIAEQMITNPKKIRELHSRLPQNKVEGIKERNRKIKES